MIDVVLPPPETPSKLEVWFKEVDANDRWSELIAHMGKKIEVKDDN